MPEQPSRPVQESRHPRSEQSHSAPWLTALRPLLHRVGGQVIEGDPAPDDVPIEWLGEVLFHVRVPKSLNPATAADDDRGDEVAPTGESTDLTDGLARLISSVEDELGGALADLPRAEKQHAVRLLEERGAFEMRRSAETVAEALGLSRFTVYNYLNRIRDQTAESAGTTGSAGSPVR